MTLRNSIDCAGFCAWTATEEDQLGPDGEVGKCRFSLGLSASRWLTLGAEMPS